MAKATHLIYWTTTYGDSANASKREDGVWFHRYSSTGRYGPQMSKWQQCDDESAECYEDIINGRGDGRVGFNKADFYTNEQEPIAVRLPN